MDIVEFDIASPFFFLSRRIGSLHVFTNVSDGYESSSDQESYSETSSGKLSKIDNAFVSRVCLETAGGLPYFYNNVYMLWFCSHGEEHEAEELVKIYMVKLIIEDDGPCELI
ncbi:hypothetical protein YC2023_041446 [Brassica napus]